jgi:small subunit ribosomal protein S6
MSQHKQNLYEGMYVIKATLSEEARRKALDKIQNGITQRGGAVVKVHDQGRRRLAYQIEGHKEGHYYVLYFNLLPAAIPELWQEYHLNEDLMRFVTLRTDEVMEKIEFKVLEEQV